MIFFNLKRIKQNLIINKINKKEISLYEDFAKAFFLFHIGLLIIELNSTLAMLLILIEISGILGCYVISKEKKFTKYLKEFMPIYSVMCIRYALFILFVVILTYNFDDQIFEGNLADLFKILIKILFWFNFGTNIRGFTKIKDHYYRSTSIVSKV